MYKLLHLSLTNISIKFMYKFVEFKMNIMLQTAKMKNSFERVISSLGNITMRKM